ncbi:hypothetical protein ACHWI2_43030, partial [Klebsiella pneumoniae]
MLEDEPQCETVPQSPIPKPLWLKVGRWGDGSLSDGLADPLAEMAYFDGGGEPLESEGVNTAGQSGGHTFANQAPTNTG